MDFLILDRFVLRSVKAKYRLTVKDPWFPGFINNRQGNVMLSRIGLLFHSCRKTVLNKFAGFDFIESTFFGDDFCRSHLHLLKA
jgi:hypothetical protein